MAIRYFVVSNHYRRPLDFSKTALGDAQNSYERLKRLVLKLKSDGKINEEYLDEFRKEMDEEFDGPGARAVLWKLVRDDSADGKVGAIRKMDEVFGLRLQDAAESKVPSDILKLAEEREKVRGEKDFERSDELRDEILKKGFVVRDEGNGFVLERV